MPLCKMKDVAVWEANYILLSKNSVNCIETGMIAKLEIYFCHLNFFSYKFEIVNHE